MRIIVFIWVALMSCWIGNVVQLIRCDWDTKGSWKGEIIHGVGFFVPPAAVVTVWNTDK